MSARIRRGKAEDADFLARVMMLASRGHLRRGVWDLIAGGSEERWAPLASREWCGNTNCRI
jgi:hypothetical protein